MRHYQENSRVIIVHGLYMNRVVMKLLQKRFIKAGWKADAFNYSTTRASLEENLQSLKEHVDGCEEKYIHFVCHSLGGLLVRCFFDRFNDLKDGRIVSLGSPHQGASIAKHLHDIGLGKLLGKSSEKGLIDKLGPWTHSNEFGSLAGVKNLGPRLLFNLDNDTSDGTVLLEETFLEGQNDHVTIDASHTQLVYSELAFHQTHFFLINGLFIKELAHL